MNWKFINIIALVAIVMTNFSCGTKEDETSRVVEVYKEQHRPQFHFSPKENWMSNPNEMFYHDGEYHLFYQKTKVNTQSEMHWAHAVSTDLVHWEDLPISLKSDSSVYVTSGKLITGRGEKDDSRMMAFCNYGQTKDLGKEISDFEPKGMIFSTDKGRTWSKSDDHLVLPEAVRIKDFRNSQLFWHKESGKWVMLFSRDNKVLIYNSSDLKSWTLTSEFGATAWESPDLFELNIEGTDETKWVMLLSTGKSSEKTAPNGGSGTQYFVGDFDGKTFTSIQSKETTLWADYGRDNYAGVTWSNNSKEDGRKFFLGWMSNWDYAEAVPTTTWQGAMTVPRELSLKNTAKGLRLASVPVKELEGLRRKKVAVDRANYGFLNNSKLVMNQGTGVAEVLVEFEIPEGSQANFGIELKNANQETYRTGFDAASNHYFSNRTNTGKIDFSEKFAPRVHLAPRKISGNRIKLHCYLDVSSAEIFTDDGMTVMTDVFFPTEDFIQINVFSEGDGGVELKGFTFYNLESIWK